MTMMPLLATEALTKSFPAADGSSLLVLDNISVQLHPGEVVALLGKSGSGKSTLLRVLAGLIPPSSGTVRYRGQPLQGANPGAAMVFQSFALLPWLTVQANVELGMQAAGVPANERRQRALAAIDQIGLDGFETAYPRELSGGMRQRVGFARAVVMRPDVLLMDEPFSALDILTTENLRHELISLWSQPDFPTSCICIVTHNIEEAVLLADRVLVMSSGPGRITAEVKIDLPRPRDRRAAAFEAAVDRLYGLLAGRSADAPPRGAGTPLANPLPAVSVGGLAGLLQLLAGQNGSADLADLAEDLAFEVDDLLPIVDAARMLHLLTLRGSQANLTDNGQRWASSDIQQAKAIFASLAEEHAPLVHTIVRALRSSADGTLRTEFFGDLLGRGFPAEVAKEQLDIAIDWGRYGELFEYDADSGELTLPKPAAA